MGRVGKPRVYDGKELSIAADYLEENTGFQDTANLLRFLASLGAHAAVEGYHYDTPMGQDPSGDARLVFRGKGSGIAPSDALELQNVTWSDAPASDTSVKGVLRRIANDDDVANVRVFGQPVSQLDEEDLRRALTYSVRESRSHFFEEIH